MTGRQIVMTIVTISKHSLKRKIETNNKPKPAAISLSCKNLKCKPGQQKMTGRQILTIEKVSDTVI